ncbi:MAG: hypothetical protein ACOY3Z_12885 [Thermodesulfobacteriota bacterium]
MRIKTIACGAVITGMCLAGFAGVALAEAEKPTADLTVAALNQYIWRGFAFSRDSVVVQPSMTVGYKGFSANMWANVDTDLYAAETKSWTETDLTLSYGWAMGPVNCTAGYIYYGLDGMEDTQEFFASAGLDMLLKPTLSVYRDTDNLAGWYLTLGVSHALPLTKELNLDLGAKVGYLAADEASSYGEVNSGIESATDAYSGLLDGVLSASVTIPVTQYFSVTPQLAYSFALSGEASDLLSARNLSAIDKDEDSFIYGGIACKLAF